MGPRSYQPDETDLFFGRERESYDVATLWTSHRLLVVYGPSGVGKTSLVTAGVGARVAAEAAEILPPGRVSQASPVPTAALSRHNPYTFALLSSWSPHDSPNQLSGLSVTDFLSRRVERFDRYDDPLPVLAAIDRFEEVFRDLPHRRRYRDEFIDHLAEAIRALPHLRLLISIREDSLASLLPYEAVISSDSRTRFHVEPLPVGAALRAVTRPLAGTGRSFAPGVAERLVDDLRTTDFTDRLGETASVQAETVEPVQLQVVCSALWEALPDEVSVITAEHLRNYGDVDRTLTDFCARAISEVAREHDIAESALRDWLARSFLTELGTRNTVYEGRSRTAGMSNAVAHALVDRHLLKAEWRSGSRWYELQHDRLIESIQAGRLRWPESDEPLGRPVDYLRAAEAALADGELDLARKHAEEAVRLAGGDPRTLGEAESFLGNLAFNGDRYDEAETRYRRAAVLFELVQDSTAVGMLLAAIGQLLLRAGRHAEAVSDLQGAVARLQGDRMLRVELAHALWQAGQLRGAEGVYGGVLSYAPATADALAGRGALRTELGDFEGALEDLDNLARLRPAAAGSPEVQAARAYALAELGRIDEARALAGAALARAPADGAVQWRAAVVAARAGDTARAVALLRGALEGADPPLMPHQHTGARRLLEELGGERPNG
ncbi:MULTISPECIES: tetratricopeptide repeat protein [unclassified Pseudofrankia]|uniref:tetratricopeptide repeat protein n=1 Tax=unclassified Pseudofrankia TaxID=2994372 RepID=UPI0018E3BF97|nr:MULTISPECIES: tetratricopeptide repeat protein [unclassified Pseudofrankia]MDT3444370.1 tetratricopeptide repeat protein [Pseudofrankia sp. BMG5.37]